MTEKARSILKGAVLLLVALIAGFFLFVLFFRPSAPPSVETPPEEAVPGEGLPSAPEGGEITVTIPPDEEQFLPEAGVIVVDLPPGVSRVATGSTTYVAPLVDSPVGHLSLSSDGGKGIFLSQEDGRFYTVGPDGRIIPFSDARFRGADDVTFAPDAKKAIIEFPDDSKVIYNFQTQKQVTLPSHWDDFDFSPSSQEVVGKSLGLDPENRWLVTFRADGSGAQQVERIGENADRVAVDWSPNEQMIALYQDGIDFNRQRLLPVGRNEENFRATIIEGRGYVGQWSPTGDRLLYSVYSTETDLKPSLWAVDLSGERIGYDRIHIPLETWADKCALLDNERAYCGVPRSLPRGTGAFRAAAQGLPDDLYLVNYKTGATSRVAALDGDFSITQPTLTSDGRHFMFIDEITGKLRQIQLK